VPEADAGVHEPDCGTVMREFLRIKAGFMEQADRKTSRTACGLTIIKS
jgi:hypothetical protein